jgi:hypothetical protein
MDYMRMVQEGIDIVSVCTPPETHKKIVCDIAPFVKAIYCEKPIALTLEDADAMIKCCHYHGTILQINHQRRFINPKVRFSRGVLNTGTHLFDLLRKTYGDPITILPTGNALLPDCSICEIEEVKTDEPIFEFDLTRSKEPMIIKGVSHLVDCLLTGCKNKSSGEDGREALRLALDFKEINELQASVCEQPKRSPRDTGFRKIKRVQGNA